MAQLTLNSTTLLGATTGTIASYLLPVAGRQLLLPSASVAEVVEGAQLSPVAGKPAWFMGHMSWRDGVIPVVSFEVLNGAAAPANRTRVAIVNAIGGNAEITNYGILLQSLPRAAKVKIAELEDLESAPTGPVEFLQVRYAGELAIIPDLDALEAKLLIA